MPPASRVFLMNNLDFKNKILPHLIAIGVFLVLVAVYFSPAVFGGKALQSGDVVTWAGNSKAVNEHRAHFSEEALWAANVFSGMPAYTISVIYSGELLEYVEKVSYLGLPYPVPIIFMALVCAYIMLLAYNVKPLVAVPGAIAFAFFTFNFLSLEAGHNSKLRAMAFAPLLIAGLVYAFRGKLKWGFLLVALGTAFQLRAGHYQITYYTALAALFLGINEFVFSIKENRLKNFGLAVAVLLAGALIGVATNAGRLMTLQEYTQYSMRGKPELQRKQVNGAKDANKPQDYVFNWSFEKMETMTMLIPNLYGGGSTDRVDKKSNVGKALDENGVSLSQFPNAPYYWGDQPFTSGPVYAGATLIFLFVLGLLVLDARYKYCLLAAAVFSLLLTMGKHLPSFNNPMYDYFPGYNKFRTVTMAIFIAQLAIPILAVLGLDKILRSPFSPELQKKLLIAAGITAGTALLFALVPSIAGNFSSESDTQHGLPAWLLSAVQEDREAFARADAWRSVVFVLLTAGVAFAALKKLIPSYVSAIAVTVLVLMDLWPVDKRYLNKDNFEKTRPEERIVASAADNAILQDKSLGYRVLNLNGPFSESKTGAIHRSIGGYSPVKMRRYQDLVVGEIGIQRDMDPIIDLLRSGKATQEMIMAQLGKSNVLNLLNTKYLKYGDEANAVLENPYALGAAWFVADVKEVRSPDEEYEALLNFNPRSTALVDVNKFKPSATTFDTAGASVKLTEFRQNLLVYEAENPGKGLIVFSENYYPEGWQVELDGKPVSEIRADYVLRALEVPAGKHKITFAFHPESFALGNTISLVSSLSLILMLLGIVAFEGKKLVSGKGTNPESEPETPVKAGKPDKK